MMKEKLKGAECAVVNVKLWTKLMVSVGRSYITRSAKTTYCTVHAVRPQLNPEFGASCTEQVNNFLCGTEGQRCILQLI